MVDRTLAFNPRCLDVHHHYWYSLWQVRVEARQVLVVALRTLCYRSRTYYLISYPLYNIVSLTCISMLTFSTFSAFSLFQLQNFGSCDCEFCEFGVVQFP